MSFKHVFGSRAAVASFTAETTMVSNRLRNKGGTPYAIDVQGANAIAPGWRYSILEFHLS